MALLTVLPVAHAAAASAPVSDDFSGTALNHSLWQIQGGGAGTATTVSGGTLNMAVPGGSQHDLFPGSENALRVVQTIANGNFEIESKFNTLGNATPGNFQDEGIVIQQNSSTFLRFDMYSDGSSIIVFSAAASGATATQKIMQTVSSPTAPVWLRVRRTGPTYLFSYSLNGSSYTVAGSFDSLMPVAQVGVYVGNSGASPAGWTAHVDYFHRNINSPVSVSGDTFTGGSLNPGTWTFVNPGGDASQSRDGSHAVLSVPDTNNGTNSHDPSAPTNNAPRIMQNVANGDFSIDAKFDSEVTQQFQEEGIIVQQDATHFMHIDIVRDFEQTEVVVKTVGDGGAITTLTTTNGIDAPATNGPVIYPRPSMVLRLARLRNSWALSYSYNGQNWTSAFAFIQPYTVTKVGVYAGVDGGSTPAFDAKVDYFVNTTVSTANPLISVWYGPKQTFGAHGQPQRWVNILGSVKDLNGIASLTYRLNGAPGVGLSLGENAVRLPMPGEFNAEIDAASLHAGANQVVFTAVDIAGHTSTSTVTVNKITGTSWPLPYAIKWSGSTPNAQAQVADGHWIVQPDGTIRNSDIGYDRLVTIGQANTWSQYVATVHVKINSMDPDGSAVGIAAGWQGATSDLHGILPHDQPRTGHPFPALFEYDHGGGQPTQLDIYANTDAHPEQPLVVRKPTNLSLGVTYSFKFRVTDTGFGGSLFQFKIYRTGAPEPAAWLLQTTGDLSRGSIVLVAHRADVNFGSVSVVGRPSAPSITSVTPAFGAAVVNFKAPAKNGGSAITSYGTTCRSSNGGTAGIASGTKSPMTVFGLTNGRTYRCTVTAVNEVGPGSVSASSAAFVPNHQ
jgi:regulation of enolase protein 1 (concanavalin A-like superfamily)